MSERKTITQIIRFSTAGCLVIAVDFGIYYGLIPVLAYSAAKAVSFTAAGVLGYALNKYWVFKNQSPSAAEFARFVLINILALGVNVLANKAVLLANGGVLAALATATLVTNVLIFVVFKWWVFKT